jgi:uncharacterized protein YggE
MSDSPESRLDRARRSPWAPAVGVAVVVSALFLTRTSAAQSAPTASLDIHSTSAGVQVDTPQITVVGTGDVRGVPDTLTVTIGASSQAPHATEALSANSAKTQALVGSLTGSGVATGDIQTGSLSIEPTYGYGGQTISGYQVDETVTVVLHDLTRAGAILDAAARQVGDAVRIQGMSLSISDASALMGAARKQAVENARTRAQQLATGAGSSLGAIRTITEQSSYGPMPMPMAGSMDGAAKAIPVQPGSQQLSVSVTVVYQLG